MFRRFVGVCRVSLLLAALIADAAWAQTASLSGRITDDAGGTPVQGAAIQIRNRSTFELVASPISDAAGDFAATVQSGTYLVLVEAEGYRPELFDDVPCLPSCNFSLTTPVVVTAPTGVTGVDFALLRIGSISGNVVHADTSAPLPAMILVAIGPDGSIVNNTTSDFAGHYTLAVPPGSVRLHSFNLQAFIDEQFPNIDCPYSSCDPAGGALIEISSGEDLVGFDFALAPGGTIRGSVTRASTGMPVDVLVEVYLYRADGTRMTREFPDVDGVWEVRSGLPTGSYFAVAEASPPYGSEVWDNRPCGSNPCNASAGDPIFVTAPQITGGIDFALQETAQFADGFESIPQPSPEASLMHAVQLSARRLTGAGVRGITPLRAAPAAQ